MSQRYTYLPWDPPPLRPARLRGDSDLWALTKQIDELGGEWTFADFVERTANFHHQGRRINFYEHTGGWDDLAREAFLTRRAREYGLMPPESGSVRLAFKAFPSLFNPVSGKVPMPTSDEQCIGEHSAVVLGASSDELLIQHAWTGWTPTRTAIMSREYAENYATAGIVSRPWNRGPADGTVLRLYATDDGAEFRQLWRLHASASQQRVNFNGYRLRLDWYPTWSTQALSDAAVLCLTAPPDVRVAVAVLILAGDLVQVSDLFVWPPYRRSGLGSLLEGHALERAQAFGCREAEIYLWAADSVFGEERARKFIASRGYEIEAADAIDSQAIGRKSIP